VSKPPELVDELMWRVAESRDPQAQAEFVRRYPDFASELARRVAMVQSLRGARPAAARPRFAYRAPSPPAPWPRSAWAATGILAAGLAAATLALVPRGSPMPESRDAPPVVAPSRATALPGTSGTVGEPGPYRATETAAPPPARPSEPPSPFERSVSLDFDRVMLSQAVQAVAQQARLVIEVAPGFEDQEIEAHYAGVTAKQALDDLGQNFGFTVIVQQGNEGLLVPALDPNRPPTTVPEGSFSLPSETPATGNE
jgi:hypothetical protein